MAITKIIRPLPDAPDSVNDSAQDFNTKANAYVDAQKNKFQPDVNAWAVEANQLKVDMNQIKTDVDGIVSTIPAGTLNDSIATGSNAWSALNTKNKIDAKQGLDSSGNWGITSGGSGAAGFWTKFPDGTLVMNKTADVSSVAVDVSAGTMFSSAKTSITLPMATSLPYSATLTMRRAESILFTGSVHASYPDHVEIYLASSKSLPAGASKTCEIIINGRWK